MQKYSRMKKVIMNIITVITVIAYVLSPLSCTKQPLLIHTQHCDPNEVLSVYSKQGNGLVILDLMYEEDRNCMISKNTQELNNNCQDSTRYCEWN